MICLFLPNPSPSHQVTSDATISSLRSQLSSELKQAEASRAELERERRQGKGLQVELELHKQTSTSQTERIQSLEQDLVTLRTSEEESRNVSEQLKKVRQVQKPIQAS